MIYGKDILDNCVLSNKDNFEAAMVVDHLNADKYFAKATKEELKKGIPGTMVGNFSDGDKRTYLFAPYSHTLVIGGTGTGKTEGYFIPAIDAISESEQINSFFIMDLKGVTYKKTAEKLRQNGYKIYVLNFKDPFSSMRFNPLSNIYRRYRKVQELKKDAENDTCSFEGKTYPTAAIRKAAVMKECNILLAACENELSKVSEILCPLESQKDLVWDYGSRDIIFSALYGLLEDSDDPHTGMTEEKYNLYNLFNLLYTNDYDNYFIINWVREHSSRSKCRRMLSYYEMRAQQTKDCYINNTLNKLNRFNNLPTHTLTSVSDLDPYKIAADADNEKIAVFCLTDESYSITYALCLMFINQLLSSLQERRDKTGCVQAPFMFLLDEFANMPKLPAVEKWISTLRSRNIWLHLGLQSYAQLNAAYGDNAARIILDNCDTQIFFGSNNRETAENFCNSLGKTCKAVNSLSLDNNGRLASSIHPQNLPLVRQSDLDGLQLGYAYVKCFRKPVLFTKLDMFFSYRDDVLIAETENFTPEKAIELEKLRYNIKLKTEERYCADKSTESKKDETTADGIEGENADNEKKLAELKQLLEERRRHLLGRLSRYGFQDKDTEEEDCDEGEEEEDYDYEEDDIFEKRVNAELSDRKKDVISFWANTCNNSDKLPFGQDKNIENVSFADHEDLLGFFLAYARSSKEKIKDIKEKMDNVFDGFPRAFLPIVSKKDQNYDGILGIPERRPTSTLAQTLRRREILSENGLIMEIVSISDDASLTANLLSFIDKRTPQKTEIVISLEKDRPNIRQYLSSCGFKPIRNKYLIPPNRILLKYTVKK